MKGFFKLTTAALALVAFASCSNDDLFGEGQAVADAQAEGTLQVEVEQLIDGVTTRAAYVPNGTANQLYWENGDVIEVFDETMLQNDTYEYSWKRTTFENNKKKDLVKSPAYAFTTDAYSELTSKVWDTDKDQNIVTYDIDEKPFWGENKVNNEIASTKGNLVKAYKFSLPMWGTAAKTDAGVSVNMKYLTAVLRVDMAQLPAAWASIRITGWLDQAATIEAPMTGPFKAVIAEEDEVDPNAQLVELTPYDRTALGYKALGLDAAPDPNGNEIIINFLDLDMEELALMRANGGYVYIPLIAQKYGAIQFWYYDEYNSVWKLYKKTKPFEAKRGTVYRMNIEEFEIAGSDAESLNVLLKQKKDETGAVTVKTTYPTEVVDGKNVITIPAGFKGSPLTLDLEGIINTGAAAFEIESEDGKYEGDVVIDLSDASRNPTAPVYLNLPNSNVTLKGNMAGADLGIATQNKLIVKSLTIAPISDDDADKGFGPTMVKDIFPNYESFSTGDGIEVQKGTTVRDINMTSISENNDKFIKKSKIVIKGQARDITANLMDPAYMADKKEYYQEIPVTVEGGTTRGIVTAFPITLTDATVSGAAVSIWSDVTASGETDAATLMSVNENVIMSGKATADYAAAPKVDLSEEANVTIDATATTLSITGTAWAEDATMNANSTVTINLTAEGEAIKGNLTCDNTAITLTQGYIKNITGSGKKANLTFGEGEGFTAIGGIDNTMASFEFKNASTWNGKKIADNFKTDGYVGPYPITACQLASWDFSLATTLINDIDLNNQAWTPVELKANLNGSEKTIKNLAVTASADNAGLFSTISASKIENLTIDGAAVAATGKSNVGVLAGSATTALTINKVVVKNATVEGKYYLGGFVGNATGANVNSDSNANGVTFTVNDPNNNPKLSDTSDAKAGSVGQYFGAIDGAVVVPACTSTIDPAKLGFKANFRVAAGSKAYCYYGGTQAIGLATSTSTLKIGDDTWTYDGTTNFDDKADKTFGYYMWITKF